MLIGLLGGECTGKSALASELQTQLGAVIAPEALRAFVDAHGRTPNQGEQVTLMDAQEALTSKALAEAGASGIVVTDPSAAMTAIYSQIYFGDRTLDDRALGDLRMCDVVVWCQPDFPWEPDGLQRDGEAMRASAHAAIEALLTGLILDVPRVVSASGSLSTRVNSVREALAAIGS